MNPDKIRNVLNILFMILAVAAIITYFVAKDDFKMFIYVCGAAIFVKLMEFFIRFSFDNPRAVPCTKSFQA